MYFKNGSMCSCSAALVAFPVRASQVYITSWVSNASQSNVSYANICGNLNVQFPNSDLGTGATCTPGESSGLGRRPIYLQSRDLYFHQCDIRLSISNGIKFELTSNSAGEDFAQINSGSHTP